MRIDDCKIVSRGEPYQVKYRFVINEALSRESSSEWFTSPAEAVFRAIQLAGHPNIEDVEVIEHWVKPECRTFARLIPGEGLQLLDASQSPGPGKAFQS